ncbi:T-complex 11 [Lophiotrema nucula]|uniref:T-complex 11 n=1 Tax=Lophiotrema nucula TaxID=690887 RepID=A0A6A5ZH76_9PLEO|nr:T-complex 11 [Lophiotrema nucula]
MTASPRGDELAEAFLYAQPWPQITKSSLSELDIQNIITNIKLRHDVSFDKDLSFRPNHDGVRGKEKRKAGELYWDALIAEMMLYEQLFKGTPSPLSSEYSDMTELVRQSQKRIPRMFQTLQEVLKSLVPDRDHCRVDEHLDVPMLMQQIQRNVCDLPKLAEWLAQLLTEHCAPMRDNMVEEMVGSIRLGVFKNDPHQIVRGLRKLLGILEAMKLDVANHQIRNLKTLLVEDTINFERHYHLERLVNGRARVNIENAQRWYAASTEKFRQSCPPKRHSHGSQLEVFARAVTTIFFSNDPRCEFPDTFYLDYERLRQLKSEVDDLVYFEICFDTYEDLFGALGYGRLASQATKHLLHGALSAVLGEGAGHGTSHWMNNCENIAAELIRQAFLATGRPPFLSADLIQQTTRKLRNTLIPSIIQRKAQALEFGVQSQVLSTVNRHIRSSPMELFNTLVVLPGPPPPPQAPSQPLASFQHSPSNTFSSQNIEQYNDLSNRIAHIILIHWRTWGPIAYVQEEAPVPLGSTVPQPQQSTLTSAPVAATLAPVGLSVEPLDPNKIPAQQTQSP